MIKNPAIINYFLQRLKTIQNSSFQWVLTTENEPDSCSADRDGACNQRLEGPDLPKAQLISVGFNHRK
jgi:hypothetical protein